MSNSVKKNVALVIVDGLGIGPKDRGNAVHRANTPNYDKLRNEYPNIGLNASGNSVGLPEGIMGNSEVGHLTIGSGRITFQSLERINRSIRNDELRNRPEIKLLINHTNETGGVLHLMGLLSDGMVHSNQNHLHYLIDIFQSKVDKIIIHAFTDGRDTPTDSSPKYIANLQDHIKKYDNVSLATIIGRYYVMDRDKKWDRTKIAYDALTLRKGEVTSSVIETIRQRYEEGETDEFLKPIIIEPNQSIKDGDAVLFFNFRPDRARQITQAFNYQVEFDRKKINNLCYVTMTKYDEDWDLPVLFEPNKVEDTLAEILSKNKIPQIHIAETEKYAHVTYFLNGGNEEPFELEERLLIPSPKIPTYDTKPEMSTPEITEKTVDAINSGKYPFVVLNIACPDMVGHTGNLEATILAVEAMDNALGEIYHACKQNDYILIITADHGNAEKMLEGDAIHTAHTTNLVPFIVTKKGMKLKQEGGLSNVAPTVLEIMGIEKSEKMNEDSLISK